MPSFTLSEIQDAADKKYGSTDIKVSDEVEVSLTNPLRLPKEQRKELFAIQDKLQEDDADQEEILADAIRLVATDKGQAEKLIEEVGEDMGVLAEVFERYTEGSEVGEA